jgi:hypothetical protein
MAASRPPTPTENLAQLKKSSVVEAAHEFKELDILA